MADHLDRLDRSAGRHSPTARGRGALPNRRDKSGPRLVTSQGHHASGSVSPPPTSVGPDTSPLTSPQRLGNGKHMSRDDWVDGRAGASLSVHSLSQKPSSPLPRARWTRPGLPPAVDVDALLMEATRVRKDVADLGVKLREAEQRAEKEESRERELASKVTVAASGVSVHSSRSCTHPITTNDTAPSGFSGAYVAMWAGQQ